MAATAMPAISWRSSEVSYGTLGPTLLDYGKAVRGLNDFAREPYGKNVLALAVRWVLDQGPTIAL